MPVQCTCSTCGKTLTRSPSHVHPRNYCSPSCKHPPYRPEISDDGLTARIPLMATGGQIRAYAVIDADDAEWAGQWRWYLDNGYAARKEWGRNGSQGFLLHRELFGLIPNDGLEVDHKDRNRLNDRRSNLRIVPKNSQPQNLPSFCGTSSQYRGVTWDKVREKWIAAVVVQGKRRFLGRFTDEAEAATVAQAARLEFLPYAVD